MSSAYWVTGVYIVLCFVGLNQWLPVSVLVLIWTSKKITASWIDLLQIQFKSVRLYIWWSGWLYLIHFLYCQVWELEENNEFRNQTEQSTSNVFFFFGELQTKQSKISVIDVIIYLPHSLPLCFLGNYSSPSSPYRFFFSCFQITTCFFAFQMTNFFLF